MKWRVVMLRKVAILVISAGLTMSPLSVQALGFGGIKLNSSLNEKLNAEVALLSASANDVQSLTINLATEEAFLRSGIDRTALLNKLKFKVKQRANGDYYIEVITTETVREPFMNFLLELNWKNGRMLREYTMLIDPPGRGAPKQAVEPAPVMAETAAPEPMVEPVFEQSPPEDVMAEPSIPFEKPAPFVEPVIEAAPMPTPVKEVVAAVEPVIEPEPVIEMVEPEKVNIDIPPPPVEMVSNEEEKPAADAFNPESAFVDQDTSGELWPRIPLSAYSESGEDTAEQVTVESTGEMGDLDYGIVKAGDNLWNIAEKLRQGDESVSVHQVMMALLQNNPDAFIDNNVHRLKVGHVLRIDDSSTLTAMSPKESAKAYAEQTGAWNNYRQQTAEAAGVQPIMMGEDVAADNTEMAKTSGELTLSSPEGESLTAGGGANEESLNNDLATVQDQLRQAKSDAGTMRTRNVALNEKLQALEDKLNNLQRSISVKDDELAALQQQLSSLDQQPVKVPVKEEMVPAEKPAVVEEPAAEVAPVVEEQPVVAEQPVKAEEPQPAVEQSKPEKSPVELAAEIAKKEKVIEDNAPVTEPGIMDTVMGVVASIGAVFAGFGGDGGLLYILAPLVVVVLILAVIMMRRRSKGGDFQESILTGAATTPETEANGIAEGDSTTFSEESSFLSDFAMSGASAIEADDSEVDPLTEADVFMAYGRYEAAEERLNEAVQNEPNRKELRAKLLELYHATQNKEAFESSAEDFYASLAGAEAEEPLWTKVVGMGTEIAPENPLFSQAGGAAADIAATNEVPAIDDIGMAMTDSQVMDIGLETGVFEAADLNGTTDSSDDMDFNLDLGESLTDEAPSTDAEPEMDFNLDIGGGDEPAADLDFNLDMATSDSPEEPVTEEPVTEDASLDFNLDIGGEDEPAAAEEPAADLDFNLDMDTADSSETEDASLDFNLDMPADETADVSLDFDTGSADEGSLDLNLDAADTADADDMDGSDEVGTKLDLAKAYIDMGDPEGARSILDEVMDEGSSTQKEEAQGLLGQIA